MRTEAGLLGLLLGGCSVVLTACGSAAIVLDDGGTQDTTLPGATDDTGELPPAEGTCGLAVDGLEDWYLEGDTIELELRCTGDLAQDDAIFDVQGMPGEAELDGGHFEWETDGEDAGPQELLVSARPRGAGGLPETLKLAFWIYNDEDARRDEPPDPLRYTEEFGLPVMHIDVQGALGSSYKDATVWWEGKEYPAAAKIRGASSSYYTKPGYMLEFDEDELAVPWDSDDRDHLALVTLFDDNSYVRQKLVYDQWAAIAEYWGEQRLTPRTFFVVVYMDGEHHGLFMALDRPDNEFIRHMGFDDTGNLYKAVNHNANFYLTDYYGTPKSDLADGYEKKEGEPESDFTDLQALVSWSGNATDAQVISQADAHIDLEEWMDWYLLVHYSLSEDSAGKNSYMYADPGSGLFRYIPWDFNHSWGQNWYTARTSSSSLNDYEARNRVFKAIRNRTDADDALWDRFKAMREDGPFSPDWINGQLDAYYAEIELSAARDWEQWEDAYRSYSGWASTRNSYGDWTDFEGERDYLYEWVEERDARYRELVPD